MNLLLAYRWSDLPKLVGVVLVYALSIYLVLAYLNADVSTISILWILGGIGMVALLLGGNECWPTLFIGSLFALVLLGNTVMLSACVALSNTVESLLAVWLLRPGLSKMGLMQKPFDPLLSQSFDYKASNRVEKDLRLLSVAIEQGPASVVITDSNGVIEYVNSHFTAITGYTLDEAIGQNPRILQSGLTQNQIYQDMWDTLNQNQLWHGQLNNRRKNGELYWEETYISPVKDIAGITSHYVAVKFDITCRYLAEQYERSRNQVLEMLAKDAGLTKILEAIILGVEQNKPASLCSILLLDNEGKHLTSHIAPSLPDFYKIAMDNIKIGIGTGSCGTAALTGERVIIECIQTHSDWAAYKDLAAQAGLGACWSEPIKNASRKVLGTLAIYHHDPYSPAKTDIYQIEQTAILIGMVLEKQHGREALQESSRHLRTLIETTPDCVNLVDSKGILLSINDAGLKMIEASNEQSVIGQSVYGFIAPEHREAFCQFNERVCLGQKSILEFEIIGLHGTRRWLESRATPFLHKTDGKLVQLALTRDITEKKKSAEQIWRQANFDLITGLPNRHMFYERLEQGIKQAHRDAFSLVLLFLDLDCFKEVNDTLGHDMGDLLLKEAGQRLSSCIRETDSVCRLGGDEFTIILTELLDPSNIERVAHNILKKLSEPFQLQGDVAYVSVSIGVALYPDDAKDTQALIKCSDQAMYLAKNTGRNRFCYFTESMQKASQVRILIATDLRSALANEQFRLVYQPIVELATGHIHKAEALIRWQHPMRGLISPADFIPIAEEIGLIIAIGDWVFRNTVQQARHLRAVYHAEFQISINKSSLQFYNPSNYLQSWLEYLQMFGQSGQSIVIEITEGLLLDADTSASDKLLKCRDMGIQVALGDFGTGYSSLSYIKKFDIDYIKIDQSFVRNLSADSSDMVLCEAIIVMAHKLGMKVIAEGVETTIQRDLLIAAGCDYGQGYLFSSPLPADKFEVLLSQARKPASLNLLSCGIQ